MALDIARGTLYRGTINLRVEDKLTQAYLSEIWNDPAIAFFVGGGNEGLTLLPCINESKNVGPWKRLCHDRRRFSLETNQEDWLNPDKAIRRFILPDHEIENYFLHAEALAAAAITIAN